MHFHIGVAELLVFALYYVIVKAIFLVVNLEFRRNHVTVPAAVTGLLS